MGGEGSGVQCQLLQSAHWLAKNAAAPSSTAAPPASRASGGASILLVVSDLLTACFTTSGLVSASLSIRFLSMFSRMVLQQRIRGETSAVRAGIGSQQSAGLAFHVAASGRCGNGSPELPLRWLGARHQAR